MAKKRVRTAAQKAAQAARSLAWYHRNKKKANAQQKAWREANREYLRARELARRQANREKYRVYYQRWLAENKEQAYATQRKWRERNVERSLLRNARRRAEKLGVKFALAIEDIVVPKRCPVFGLQLKMGRGTCDHSPSLDRINPKKGYVRGNVAVISFLANRIKSNGTAIQHRRVAEWMDSMQPARHGQRKGGG